MVKTLLKCPKCEYLFTAPLIISKKEHTEEPNVRDNETDCPNCGESIYFGKDDIILEE